MLTISQYNTPTIVLAIHCDRLIARIHHRHILCLTLSIRLRTNFSWDRHKKQHSIVRILVEWGRKSAWLRVDSNNDETCFSWVMTCLDFSHWLNHRYEHRGKKSSSSLSAVGILRRKFFFFLKKEINETEIPWEALHHCVGTSTVAHLTPDDCIVLNRDEICSKEWQLSD